MKSSSIFIAAAALLLAAAVSCRKEEEPLPVITLTDSMVSYDGGRQSITVAAQKDWALSFSPASASEWISISQEKGTGITGLFLTVARNDGEDVREADLVVTTRSHTVKAHIVQGSKGRVAMPGWLELPALDQPRLGFFTHSMDGGAYVNAKTSGVRNWSFYYDYDAYVSWWVAYPLNKGLIGSGSRSNSWQAADPLLPASAVCDLSGGSYGGGWTRGHQIPSADRLNYAANVSTFYPTNMTPQDYDFNCYIWADLESQVRLYAARSDTLYVVTGCDVRNSTRWSGSKGGHSARIPTHYYKALLRKKGSDYSAIAFWMPHDSSIADERYIDYMISVDELEEKTGLDFFANLSTFLGKDKEAAIESADPVATENKW